MMQRNKFLIKPIVALVFCLCFSLNFQMALAKPLTQNAQPLAADALENATYVLTQLPNPVTLSKGKFEDKAAKIHVDLTKFRADGDLNGDGTVDAAVILSMNAGGTADFIDLIAVLNDNGQPKPVAATFLGSSLGIKTVSIAREQITVGYLTMGPGDGECCPTKPITATYTLAGDQLVRKPEKAFGRLLAFPQGSLYGYVNVLGEFAIDPQFVLANEFAEGLASVSYDGKTTGFINRLGEMIIEPQFAYAGNFVQGLANVGLPNPDAHQPFVVAYIDRQGELMFNGARFASAQPFSEGLAAVSLDGKSYGYINHAGELVIKPQFGYAEPFAEGLAAVKIGDKFGYINPSGQVVIQAQYDIAKSFSEGLAMVSVITQTGYIDHAGKVVIEPQFDYGHAFKAGRALVAKGGQEQYIDNTGRVMTKELHFSQGQDFAQGLAAVNIDGQFGYINLDGELAIKPQFTYAGAFDNDIALAQTADVQGIIDPTGAWLLALPRFAVNGDVVNVSEAKETQVITYTPTVSATPSISATTAISATTRQGTCATNSRAIASAHAWRCQVEDQTYDPCLTAADGKTLVCDANPALHEPGFPLELTQPLPAAQPITNVVSAIWLLQTGDNATCTVATDVNVQLENKRVTHVCSDGTVILGDVKQTGALWQAEKVHLINDAQGHFTVGNKTQVAVVVVWQAAQP